MTAFDSKRYLLDDNIFTLAFGHYRIKRKSGKIITQNIRASKIILVKKCATQLHLGKTNKKKWEGTNEAMSSQKRWEM